MLILKHPFGVSVSVPLDKTLEALLVRIESDKGHIGWGETLPLPGTRAAIDELGLQLIGQNPLEYRRMWRSHFHCRMGWFRCQPGQDWVLPSMRKW